MIDTSTLLTVIVVVSVVASFLIFFTYAVLLQIVPFWLQCRRCSIRLASVKVNDANRLSSRVYADAGVDVLYAGRHVCSECWEELKDKGFSTGGTWAPGATVEYLKTTPNFIAIFISVGALVVSIIALLR